VFGTDVTQHGSFMQLGNGNDLGFRLNGFPWCPSSLSFAPSGTAHVTTRSRASASVGERSCTQASSATRGKKEHLCDRYHIANATAALATPRMFGGALVPSISGSMESDCGPLRRRHSAEKAVLFRAPLIDPSSFASVRSTCCHRWLEDGGEGVDHERELSIKEDKKCAEPGGGP
jgi:hypothetical protein